MGRPSRLPPGLRLRAGAYYGRWMEGGKQVERRLSSDVRVATDMLAELRRRAELAAAGMGEPAPPKESDIDDCLRGYVADLQSRAGAQHAQDVERGIRRVLELLGHPAKVGAITTRALAEVQSALARTGSSHRTAGKLAGYVSTWLRWAARHGHIPHAPSAPKKLPTGGRHAKHVRRRLTPEECNRLQRAADERGPIGDLVAVLLGTGMRLREATGLQWEDLTPAGLRLGQARTKTGKGRVVAIASDLRERLERLRADRPDSPWILLAPRGGRWDAWRAADVFREAIEMAGLERIDHEGRVIDFHALRHTYATHLAATGVGVPLLMRQLGWTTAAMAQVYVDLAGLDDAAQAAADALQRMRSLGQGKGKEHAD